MAKTNINFNNKTYSIENSLLAPATARLEAHLISMMGGSEVLEGDGQEFHKFAPAALTFRSTAPLNELQEVQINGVAIDPSNYITEEGSTVITLPIEYLKTLDVDNYEISVVSENKSVSGGFSVVEPELNEHGFYYNQPYSGYHVSMGYIALFVRENGFIDVIDCYTLGTVTYTYVIDGDVMTVNSELGELHITWSSDSLYCAELGFTLDLTDENIAADTDFIYIYREDLGGYEVTCIDKTKAEYGKIKSGINGIDTVKLANYMFFDTVSDIASNITSITIPDSVATIGKSAFDRCVFLTNVNFGENSSLEIIEEYAFYECPALASIALPNRVRIIELGAFCGCTSLVEFTCPDKIKMIWSTTFMNCENLRSVVINKDMDKIEGDAFNSCTNLTTITFNGTMAQWNALPKGDNWNLNVPATHVHCTDGDVAL